LPLLAKDYQLVLEPGRAERHYWRDVWAYRELFAILAWRDVAVRYKQTVIGVLWAVVRPLLTMVGTRRSARKALSHRQRQRPTGPLSTIAMPMSSTFRTATYSITSRR
jgi:ABC-type polysaccharide/polyol phosphate export permease